MNPPRQRLRPGMHPPNSGPRAPAEHSLRGGFFVSYSGPSMNPTLCEPEIVEVVPSGGDSYRVGDVICFMAPEAARLTVHRIIHINPDGITTRGDNNPEADPFLLRPENIKGRVVAALHGRKRRKVAGGVRGRCISRWFSVRRMLDRSVSPRLHPLYRALAQKGRIAGLLPKSHRPRVVRVSSAWT